MLTRAEHYAKADELAEALPPILQEADRDYESGELSYSTYQNVIQVAQFTVAIAQVHATLATADLFVAGEE